MGAVSALTVGPKKHKMKRANKKKMLAPGYIPDTFDQACEIAKMRNKEAERLGTPKSKFYLEAMKRMSEK